MMDQSEKNGADRRSAVKQVKNFVTRKESLKEE
jgi:hypothetical protein